ncbi:MAG: PaaI family thioesterase [Acidimicrobiales bacterium]
MTQLDEARTVDAAPSGPVERKPQRYFIGDIPFGFEVSEDGMEMVGDATLSGALRSSGCGLPRPSVLATIADCVAGIPACWVTAPSLAVTLDIAVWMAAGRCGDDLSITGTIVKRGLSTVAGEIRFSDATTTELVAISYLTFMPSPRPQDQAPPVANSMRTEGSMPVPFPEHVGVRVVSTGVAEVDLVRFTTQAAGTLQGGIVALVAEVAAESLSGTPVLDLDVRYLNAVRVGPGRATATLLGRDLVRVEVHDGGSDDRLAALVMARMAPPR